jgi:cyclophilin family peptidyl-prolyl cis-trans isomerase
MRTVTLVGLLAGFALLSAAEAKGPDATAVLQNDLARIAAWEDGRTRGRGALDALSTDARVPVRLAAVRALGRLQVEVAEAPLVAALADASPAVRAEAAFALGQLPGVALAPLVARWAVESDRRVQHRLLEALGKRADPIEADALLVPAEHADAGLRARARVALALVARREAGRTAVSAEALAGWLGDPAVEGRRGAAYLLQRAKTLMDASTQKAALACAKDADAVVRLRCVSTLRRFGAATQPALLEATADADWRVQAAAVAGVLESPEAVGSVLAAAATRLSGDPAFLGTAAVQPLLVALDAARGLPAHKAITAAAQALLKASTKIAEPAAVAFGAQQVRCRAAAVLDAAKGKPKRLARCGSEGLPPVLMEVWTADVLAGGSGKRRFKRLKGFFEKTGSPGRVAVLGHVFSKEAEAARAKVAGKRGLKAREAAEALLAAALSDADPAVVGTAAEVVARLKAAGFEAHLLEAYRRMMAAEELEAVLGLFEAMAAIKSKRAVAVLEQHSMHPQRALRTAAAKALKAIVGANTRRAGLPPSMRLNEPIPAKSLAQPSKWTQAIVHTSKGPVTLRLLGDAARGTVKNFVRLAQKGFYDGKLFHRVVPGFVAQGGDPRGDGWGGPGYTIRCEINPQPYVTGAVGMALAGKDTGSSQFFITHAPHPHLDGGYTVFAQVEQGQAAVDALLVGDRIVRIELVRGTP